MISITTLSFVIILFIWFLIAMWFLRRRHSIREKVGPIYYAILSVVLGGLILDVLFNWTFGVVIFFDITPDITLSKRLQRYREDPIFSGTWRMRWADWICEHLLNPYDPNKHHC